MVSVFVWVLLLWLATFPAWGEADVPVRKVQVSELNQKLSLNGAWQLLGPEQQVWQTRVPGAWEQHYASKRIPHFGSGSYRLKVQFPPTAVGQYFKIYTSLVGGEFFHCYANEQLVGRNGFKENSTSRVVQFFPFRLDQTALLIRCEVRNTKLHTSGLIRSVSLGPAVMIDNLQFKEKMGFNFVVGVFLFLGLFHLLLYAGYRQDKALLWFAFFCFSLGLFGEFYNARSWEFLFGEIPVEISARITRIALYMILPSFFGYAYYTAPKSEKTPYISAYFVKLITWFNLFCVVSVLLPIHLHSPFMALWLLLMTGCVLYNIFLLVGFVRVPSAYPFLFSSLIFSFSLLNDFLNGLGILYNGNVSRYGLLLFCLVQAIFLSWRMQHNYQQALSLQNELTEVNENLDSLVSERTQEIQAKNEELHKLVRFKDEMTQMMVHDLKTPLSTLLNLPSQQTILSPEARNSFEVASKRMLTLIENMLNLKQAESSELTLQLKPQRLYTLTKQVFLTVTPWATSKKITLLNQVNPQHQVRVDVLLFERVVLNLLDNAIKHTPIGGEVTISSEMDGPLICYRIADTGVGIPTDLLSKVFDKNQSFTQGQTPRSSGLGLHFCRQIIAAHQGQIAIESSPTGTQVMLSLPACREPLPTNPVWLPQQLQVVRPIAQQLSELEVFEVSKIHAALHELKTSSDQGVLDWLSALEGAVREVNAAAFGRLIAQVIADPQA
jgi:signal transduction histidine kinase